MFLTNLFVLCSNSFCFKECLVFVWIFLMKLKMKWISCKKYLKTYKIKQEKVLQRNLEKYIYKLRN